MNNAQSLEQATDLDTVQLLTEAESLLTCGKLDKSESLCRLALDINQRNPDAISLLGLVAHKSGHTDQAKQLFSRATETAPKVAVHHFRLGNIHFDKGDLDDAIASYRRALLLDPNYFAVLVNLGNTLLYKEKFDDVVDVSLKVLDHSPRCPEALSNLGQAYIKLGRFSDAYSALAKTVKFAPSNTELRNNLGVLQQLMGDVDGAIDSFQIALDIDQHCRLAERNLKIAVLNSPRWDMCKLFDLHESLGHRYQKISDTQLPFPTHNFSSERKLRIGYLASDFCEHPVGRNLLPLIKNHDHSLFQINLYSCVERPDKLTQEYMHLADQWREIGCLGDHQIAKVITDDQIDIMVYLAGRFNLNRPEVAAHRPAPVQISFHDGTTTGLKTMDYWLTDADLHSEESEEKFFEEIYRLPQFYQFTLPKHFPQIAPPPVLHNGYVTFGSFNKPEKFSEEVVALWARLLSEVPGARLLLKYHNFFSDKGMKKIWKARFEKYGLHTDRLTFLAQESGQSDHLALYSQIDIALDPFPFNGVTTTFEALLMGVPVIALQGKRFADRVACTLLKQTSLEKFAAHSPEAYVSIATALANKPQKLSGYRGKIRETFLSSSLFDGLNYARNVENAYRTIWQKRCSSET